jgi:hypothetical protein
MNLSKLLLAVLACACVAGGQLEAKSEKVDPIVGVWLQNQAVVCDPSLLLGAQAIFNSDGTVSRNLDANLQRVFGPPLFPEGTVFSISDDYSKWKKVSKCHYSCVGTQIMLIKQEDGTFEPLARAKCVIDIKLSGDRMTATETLTFFDYYDLSLTIPFPGLPPSLKFTIEGKKL